MLFTAGRRHAQGAQRVTIGFQPRQLPASVRERPAERLAAEDLVFLRADMGGCRLDRFDLAGRIEMESQEDEPTLDAVKKLAIGRPRILAALPWSFEHLIEDRPAAFPAKGASALEGLSIDLAQIMARVIGGGAMRDQGR